MSLCRVGAAAAALTGLAVLAAAPAGAESASLDYTCSVFSLTVDLPVGELPEDILAPLEDALAGGLDTLEDLDLADLPLDEVGDLPITAVFDSAIGDGATTTVGSTVALSPLTTTITLPPETVAALTGIDLPVATGGLLLSAGIDETGTDREALFDFEQVSLTDGRLTLSGGGEADSFTAQTAGDHTYVAGDLQLILLDPEDGFAAIECTLDEGQDSAIDQITAKAGTSAPAPTPTTTAPAPVRPVVVQTDAAQPTSPTWLPFAAAGASSIVLVGGLTLTRRSAARR